MNGRSDALKMDMNKGAFISPFLTLANARPNMDLELVLWLWFAARFATFLVTARLSVGLNLHCCFVSVYDVYKSHFLVFLCKLQPLSSPYSHHESFDSSLSPMRDPSSNVVHLILMLLLPLLSQS